jgi:hypothetical protein
MKILSCEKFVMTIFKFIGQFYLEIQRQEEFSELGNRVFLDNGLGSFHAFLILQIWNKAEVVK